MKRITVALGLALLATPAFAGQWCDITEEYCDELLIAKFDSIEELMKPKFYVVSYL